MASSAAVSSRRISRIVARARRALRGVVVDDGHDVLLPRAAAVAEAGLGGDGEGAGGDRVEDDVGERPCRRAAPTAGRAAATRPSMSAAGRISSVSSSSAAPNSATSSRKVRTDRAAPGRRDRGLLGVDRDREHGVEADDLAEQRGDRDERGRVGPDRDREPGHHHRGGSDDLGGQVADDPEDDPRGASARRPRHPPWSRSPMAMSGLR